MPDPTPPTSTPLDEARKADNVAEIRFWEAAYGDPTVPQPLPTLLESKQEARDALIAAAKAEAVEPLVEGMQHLRGSLMSSVRKDEAYDLIPVWAREIDALLAEARHAPSTSEGEEVGP